MFTKKILSVLIIVCVILTIGEFAVSADATSLIAVDMTLLDGLADYCYSASPYYQTLYYGGAYEKFYYGTVKGVFGKSADDVSVYIHDRIGDGGALMPFEMPGVTSATYKAGNTLNIRFKAAYSVLNGASPMLQFESNAYSHTYLLSVSETGMVNFIGADRGMIPCYQTNRWYDYNIVIKSGVPVSGGVTNTFSLYVDGKPYGENIQQGTEAITQITKCQLHPQGAVSWYPGFIGLGTNVGSYLDDVYADLYTSGEPAVSAVTLSSRDASVAVSSNGTIQSSEVGTTVQTLLNAVTASPSASVTSMECIDTKFNTLNATDSLKSGYLKLTLVNGNIILRNIFASPTGRAAYLDMDSLKNMIGTSYYVGFPYKADGVTFIENYLYSYLTASGMFGKKASDVSSHIVYNGTVAAGESYIEMENITATDFKAGDIIVFNAKIAHTIPRRVGIELNTGLPYVDNAFLSVSKNGDVTFARGERGTIPFYRTGRWYDYSIVIKTGVQVDSYIANLVSLYIDGVPYAEDIIANILPMEKFGRFRFRYNGNALSEGEQTDVYLDDIGVSFYKDASNIDPQIISIASNSASVVVDGTCVAADASLAVSRLISALDLPQGTSCRCLKPDFTVADSADVIGDGFMLEVTAGDKTVYRDLVAMNGSITVQPITFNYDSENKTLTANISASSRSNDNKTATLLIAAYYGDQLAAVKYKKVSLDYQEKNFLATLSLSDNFDRVTAFVWDNYFRPLTQACGYVGR